MADEVMSEKEIARALGATGTDVVRYENVFTDDEALGIKSWDDINLLLAEREYETVLVDEVLGDGFQIMSTDDKMRLVGVPMHILDWKFYEGKLGGFVSARVIVKVGNAPTDIQKFRIADGSTGVYQDLQTLTAKLGRTHSVSVRRGFRVSEYEKEVEQNGKTIVVDAKTFYLDTSA